MTYLSSPPTIVAIGASGSEGLTDIIDVLKRWPSTVPAVILVALHRPSDRISHLQEVLAKAVVMPVKIAAQNDHLSLGCVYIGEPGDHLTLIEGGKAGLIAGSKHEYRNRTVDLLFSSVAKHAKVNGIGIILSGSLDDGSRGLAEIHHAGGLTAVLKPGNKPVGMQQNAIDFDGPINYIGSAAEVCETIMHLLEKRRERIQP